MLCIDRCAYQWLHTHACFQHACEFPSSIIPTAPQHPALLHLFTQHCYITCRYAALLEATMEHCPHVCSIPPTELMAFCSDSGYRCRLELEGSLLMPPDYNVHITDWERSLRLRCVYLWVAGCITVW
jgi:hypothetical protein